jgi:hypothetical protein
MTFRVTQQRGLSNAYSPFRVIEQTGREVKWINQFLDQERVRSAADSTLRSYAHDLLHFIRWWAATHKTSDITQQAVTESTFLDYIRFQADQNPPPTLSGKLAAGGHRVCPPTPRLARDRSVNISRYW